MKLSELKKAKPVSAKSSGTDDPAKYVGGWESYDSPQGINDGQDPKVLAMEDIDNELVLDGHTQLSIELIEAVNDAFDKIDNIEISLGLSNQSSSGYINALFLSSDGIDYIGGFKLRYSDHTDNYGSDLTIRFDEFVTPVYDDTDGEYVNITIAKSSFYEMIQTGINAIMKAYNEADKEHNIEITMEDVTDSKVLELTPALLTLAKTFIQHKWSERYIERNGIDATPPTTRAGSCKFVSMFTQKVFGGIIRGSWDHQFNIIDGNVIDLNIDEPDVINLSNPHKQDKSFWNNKDHKASMKSCEPRVNEWVNDFLAIVAKKKINAIESSYGPSGTTRVGPETDSIEYPIGPNEMKAIKQSRKAPKKQVRKNARALSAKGKPPILTPRKIMETIRRPITGTLNNEYEIIDGDENIVGFARVVKGIIEQLDYDTSAQQEYRGHIMSAILSQIVTEADHRMANLSVQITEMDSDIKYLFERFGFRLAGGNIMKRNAGAIRPTSVQSTAGMSNRLDEAAMKRHEMMLGLSQWVNSDIALVGGGRAGGGTSAGETRLRYDIYDMIDIDMDNAEANKVGYTDLNVRDADNQIVGLVNIKITKKRGGIGKRVINALLDTFGEIRIYDIQKSARKFWDAMGIEYDKGGVGGVIRR